MTTSRLRRLLILIFVAFCFLAIQALAQKTVNVKAYIKKDGTVVQPYDRKAPEHKGATAPESTKPPSAPATATRDEHDGLVRSEAAKHEFMRMTGFPNGRPGYVVDHIVPLVCGGADAPSNMQWQTIAEAKAKDKMERVNCAPYRSKR